MKLRVNSARCQRHMVCVMLAPGSFELSDDGAHAAAREEFVSADRVDEVIEASEACPEHAIIVVRDTT